MKRAITVIVNAGAGEGSDDALAERLRALFRRAGADPSVHVAARADDLPALVEAAVARRPDVIVAGGGDGTVNAVGRALVDGAIALGVLPLGTLNHFAKDLKLPLDLEGAVERIVHGEPARIDVGEVNGHVFFNNSSLGLYPDIVRDRERQQKRWGRGKGAALVWASLAVLRRFPFLNVRLRVDGAERTRRTPFVFIGNNEYVMNGFAIGERQTLAGGCLSLYVAQRPGRWRLLQLALRAVVGQLEQTRDFEASLASEIVVESHSHRLRVATDGEIALMVPPLRYRIRPACLLVAGAGGDARGRS